MYWLLTGDLDNRYAVTFVSFKRLNATAAAAQEAGCKSNGDSSKEAAKSDTSDETSVVLVVHLGFQALVAVGKPVGQRNCPLREVGTDATVDQALDLVPGQELAWIGTGFCRNGTLVVVSIATGTNLGFVASTLGSAAIFVIAKLTGLLEGSSDSSAVGLGPDTGVLPVKGTAAEKSIG